MKRRVWTLAVLVVAIIAAAFAAWRFHFEPKSVLAQLPPPPQANELGPEWRERVQDSRSAIARSPDRGGAIRELGRLYHANRRYDEARLCYAALAREEGNLSAKEHYFLADTALQLGDVATAAAELNRVLEREPNYLPARVTLALALLKSGDAGGARREFEAVVKTEPLHLEANVNLARLALQQNEQAEALNRLERLVAARPEATSAASLLAQLLERRGDRAPAAAYRERSRQKPDPIAPDPWLAELDSYLYDLGLLGLRFEECAQAGETARAQVFLAKIKHLDPRGPLGAMLQGSVEARAQRHSLAVSHFREALDRGADPEKLVPVLVASLLALNDAAAALTLTKRLLAERPDSIPLLVAHSEALLRQKDRPEARDVFKRVLQVQPYLPAQAFALAEILWSNREFDAAARYLERVAESDSKHLASRALLAEHHLRRSEPDLALKWLAQAVPLGSTDPAVRQQLAEFQSTAHRQRAQLALRNAAPQDALRELERALDHAADPVEIHAERAKILVELRDYAGAAEALEKLAALQPENPTVLLSLGDLRLAQGQTDAAMLNWKKARGLVASGDEALRTAIDQRLTRASSTKPLP